MKRLPKNILPKATIVPERLFRACFERAFSAAHRIVAARIRSSGRPNDEMLKIRRFAASRRAAAAMKRLLIFSFRKRNAKAAAQRKSVLWRKPAFIAVVDWSA